MNKIYKTVWNALRHCLVVVNEATKSLGGQSSGSGRHQGSICAQTPARHRIQSKKCFLAPPMFFNPSTDNHGIILEFFLLIFRQKFGSDDVLFLSEPA